MIKLFVVKTLLVHTAIIAGEENLPAFSPLLVRIHTSNPLDAALLSRSVLECLPPSCSHWSEKEWPSVYQLWRVSLCVGGGQHHPDLPWRSKPVNIKHKRGW